MGQLRGVSFPDASDGWTVGTGATAAAGYGGLILHTADGGASWVQQLFPSQAAQSQATFLRAVYFLNPTTGWVVGANNLSNGSPIILATTDGGNTWGQQTGPAGGGPLYAVTFANSSTGWAVGSTAGANPSGLILATSNGGATWTAQSIPSGITSLNGVAFANASTGWAVGGLTAGGAVILATSNGGATWTAETPPSTISQLNAVTFTSATTGWAVGFGGIIATTDGGVTWTVRSSSFDLNSLSISGATGWAVGPADVVLATTDGGTTWNQQTTPSTGDLWSVAATGASTAVIVGDGACGNPTILTTINGGSVWTEQVVQLTVISELRGISFPSATAGWVVGSDSCGAAVVMATTDGGATWHRQALPPNNIGLLWGVTFANTTTGWAVGNEILGTTDGGTTWTVLPASQPGGLLGVASVGTHVWAVGYNSIGGAGMIMASPDGGATWSQETVPAGVGFLYGVTFISPTTGWAVGYSSTSSAGVILKTTDGGATWTLQAVPAGVGSLFSITFANAATGWAVGDASPYGDAIVATSNGGTTWAKQTAPSGSGLRGVSFTSATTGWAVGFGQALTTANGGASWVASTSYIPNLFGIASFGASSSWAVGDIGCQIFTEGAGVIMATSGGGSTWATQFSGCPPLTPVVNALSTNYAPAPGGNTITVYGADFTGSTAVTFGSTPAATFHVVNDSQLTAVVPPGTGTVHVRVTTPNGVTPIGYSDGITYLPAVAALPAIASRAYGGYTTSIYVQNIGAATAAIDVRYVDANGTVVGAGDHIDNVPPKGGWSWNGSSLPVGTAGSAEIYSNQPVAAFVNESAPGTGADATSYTAIPLSSGTGTQLYAPAIANGAYGGYTTGLGIINTGSASTTLTITYRDTSGATVDVQTILNVGPGAYQGVYSGSAGLPAAFAGTATIASSGGQPLAAIVNEVGPGGQFSSYDAVPTGSTTLFAPVALRNAFGGYNTGMGIQNTSSTPGTLTFTYYDSTGTSTTTSYPVAANGYVGVYQGTDIAADGAYTAKITSDVPIAAIVNEVAPSSTSAKQSTAYNTFAAGSSTLHLPLVVSNGPQGWSTGEGIMNTGSTATTVTVSYYDVFRGTAVGTAQSQLVQPNAFWGLYQPTGGLPTSPGATAVITTSSGGNVAVICNESSATLFMSYSGQ